jgi:hypothetical protein
MMIGCENTAAIPSTKPITIESVSDFGDSP